MFNNIKAKLIALATSFGPPVDQAKDEWDERNIPYELVGADNNSIPKYYCMDDGRVTDQGLRYDTRNGCVFFGEVNNIHEKRYTMGNNDEINPVKLCDIAVERGVLSRENGAYLIDGPKLCLSLGYIDGYSTVSSIESMKKAIYSNGPISVGSNKLLFTSLNRAPYIAEYKADSSGHKFIIVGWDDDKEYFICEDSYGTRTRDKGRFYLLYNDVERILYPTRTVNHINDSNMVLLQKYIKEAKQTPSKQFLDAVVKLPKGNEKMLRMLAGQIVYLKKVNGKELLALLK